MSNIFIMIPARMESSRFPKKPLAKILNKELIIRVLERCKGKYNLYAVVNSKEISYIVEKNGYQSILIKEECQTGTDRIYYAAKKLNLKDEDLIINVQGDEPLVDFSMIQKVIEKKIEFPEKVVNASSSINSIDELTSKSVIKMAINKFSDLIFASRSPIPTNKGEISLNNTIKQTCIYAFTYAQLRTFFNTERGVLEKSEDIEILRFTENKLFEVAIVNLGKNNLHAVDYPEDIEIVEKLLKINEI